MCGLCVVFVCLRARLRLFLGVLLCVFWVVPGRLACLRWTGEVRINWSAVVGVGNGRGGSRAAGCVCGGLNGSRWRFVSVFVLLLATCSCRLSRLDAPNVGVTSFRLWKEKDGKEGVRMGEGMGEEWVGDEWVAMDVWGKCLTVCILCIKNRHGLHL